MRLGKFPAFMAAVGLLAAAATTYAASDGTVTFPIDVETIVTTPTVFPGGFGDADVYIDNHHPSITADVEFRVGVRWSDGTTTEFTGLGSPVTLPPEAGIGLFISFIVPPDAPAGTATLGCRVRASAAGTSGGPYIVVTDNSTFTVL